jgi:hypothetical protein
MSTIITRNSATSGSVPSSLIQGELAINVTDGRLFYGSGSGNVVKEFVASGSGGGGTIDTGSFVTTSSFNAYTGSNTSQFAGTASYATTASYYGGSVLSASYAQTASYAPAYLPLTGGTINGNVTVNGTASIAFLNVTYESASVIYSSGSNQFGDASNDVQTLWGTVDIKSGPVLVTGSVIANSFTGSLLGTASYAINALSASYAPSSPAFPFTGSAGITGSLTVVGPTTSTQIGAGAAPSGSVPLDVRAQGALSTDIAFRVRNSANNANIFKIQGDANASLGETTDASQKTFSVNASSNSRLVLGSGYSTDTGVFSLTRRYYTTVTVFNDNALLLSHNSFSDGNNIPYKHHYVNPSTYYGSVPAYGYNAGFMWFKDSAVIANLQMKLSPDNVLSIYTSSASPLEAIITGSAFQLWASGSLGNAKPYIRTQNGTLLYLGDQSLLYNVTASSITSSFTGSLLGTASYATNALSASYAPDTTFPYTGSAGITGSLTVVGPTTSTQIGAGAAPIVSVPLDVRAQGALSTDQAFRIRNSANTVTLIESNGDGSFYTRNNAGSNLFQMAANGGFALGLNASITNATVSDIIMGNNASVAAGSTERVVIGANAASSQYYTIAIGRQSSTSGRGSNAIGMGMIVSALDSTLLGTGYNGNITNNINNSFMWTSGAPGAGNYQSLFVNSNSNLVLFSQGQLASGTNYESAATNTITIRNGIAPITNITGSFQLYSSASSSGNSKPYFRTENGTVVWLGDESRLYNVTSSIILNGTSSAPSLNTTAKVTTVVGSNTIYSIPTASYDGAWFEYTARSASNARAGQIMSIWSGSSVNFTETTTTDFGTTTGIAFTVIVSGSNLVLTGSSATAGWTIKTIVRSI